MATSIGSAFLSLGANTAEFKKGLDSASKKLDTFDKSVQGRIKSVKKLGAAFNKAGAAMTKNVTGPIVAMAAGLLLLTKSSADYADQIDKASIRTGLTSEKIQELSFVADQAGVEFSTIESSIARLTKSMGDAEAGSKRQADAFKTMGISIRSTDGEMRSMDDIFPAVIEKLSKMPNITERNALAMEIFGKSANNLVPLLAKLGTEGIDELSQKAHDLGLIMSQDGINALVLYKDEMSALGQQFQAVGRIISVGFAKFMTNTIIPLIQEKLIPALSKAAKFMSNLDPATKKIIVVVAGLAAALGPALLLLGFLGTTIIPMLITGFGLLTGPILLVIAAIALAAYLIIDNWDSIVEYFTTGEGVQMFDAFAAIVDNAMDAFIALWDLAVDVVMALWGMFGGDIESGTDGFMSAIGRVFTRYLNAISGYFGVWESLFKGDWKGLWKNVKIIVQNLFGKIPAMLAGLMADMLATIADSIKEVTDWLRKIPKIPGLDTVLKPILKMADSLEGSIRKGSDAVRALADDLAKVVEVGTEAGEAVRNAIKEGEKEKEKEKEKGKEPDKNLGKTLRTLDEINMELVKASRLVTMFGGSAEDIAKKQMTILKGVIVENTDEWGNLNRLGNRAFEIYTGLEKQLSKVKDEAKKTGEEVATMIIKDPFEGWVQSLKDVGSAVASIFDEVLKKIKGVDIIGNLVSGNFVGAAGALVGGVVSKSDANIKEREGLNQQISDIQKKIDDIKDTPTLTKEERLELTSLALELEILEGKIRGVGPSMDAMEGLVNKFNEAMEALFETLVPVLDAVFDALTPLVGVLTTVIEMFGGLLSKAVEPLTVALSIISDILTEHFMTLVEQMKPMINLITDIAPELARFLEIIKPLAGPLTQLLGAFIRLQSLFNPALIQMRIFGIFLKVLNNILEPFLPTIEMFANKIERSVDLFDNWLDGATDLSGLFKFLTEKVLPGIISVGQWLGKTFSFLGVIVNEVVVPVFKFFAKAVVSIIEGIVGIINSIINKINSIFKTDINTIDMSGLKLPSATEALEITAPTVDAVSLDLAGTTGTGTGSGASTGGGKSPLDINLSGMFTIRGEDLVLVLKKEIRRSGFGGFGG